MKYFLALTSLLMRLMEKHGSTSHGSAGRWGRPPLQIRLTSCGVEWLQLERLMLKVEETASHLPSAIQIQIPACLSLFWYPEGLIGPPDDRTPLWLFSETNSVFRKPESHMITRLFHRQALRAAQRLTEEALISAAAQAGPTRLSTQIRQCGSDSTSCWSYWVHSLEDLASPDFEDL
ncbi:hypothetical protein FQA47_010876 [Oryzias melastigma]|uniref:Uncharacterized protein n=1 Tax=Oryzias melastigma TaxID=30732 RepID=A0A834FEJ6_ORYME|nr:hypothetical protein FQA47_010876 [Oryzias melastigma]